MKCEYCNWDKDNSLLPIDSKGRVFIRPYSKNNYQLIIKQDGQYYKYPINYCPMCGRNLIDEDQEEK